MGQHIKLVSEFAFIDKAPVTVSVPPIDSGATLTTASALINNSGGAVTIDSGATLTTASALINNSGATITISGTLTETGTAAISNAGTITLSGGTLQDTHGAGAAAISN